MSDSDGRADPRAERRHQLKSEQRLVRQLLERQPDSWREFVMRYQRIVYARVRLTGQQYQLQFSAADLEDVSAAVFSGLLARQMHSLRHFQHRCLLATWLGVIARRAALRHARRKSRQERLAVVDPHAVNGADHAGGDPLQRLIDAEEFDRLAASLARLRDEERHVLELWYKHELSYREIGEQLGISINSVGPKIYRAAARLRKLMEAR